MSEIKRKGQNDNQENMIENIKSYLKGVKSEWGKVTWPERKQVLFETIIVLIVTTFFTVAVYAIDKIYAFLIYGLQYLNVIPK